MGKFSVQTVFANDRPLALAGMEFIASSTSAIKLVGMYKSADELIGSLARQSCDIALIDYSMRGNGQMEGLALLGYLRRTFPKVGIVTLLTYQNPVIIRSILARGVSSVVSKFDDIGHIVTAIHSSYGGGNYLSPTIKGALDDVDANRGGARAARLSPREIGVIRLYLSGLSVNEIARLLNKGKQTISAQKASAMQKLGVKNDVELIKCAIFLDLVDDSTMGGVEDR
ncbi:helix-turn-helix transcriptional regulator [Burkholderia ubonensis]|uniref:response regulator transcription factor n=1 Tax=Burkholderia ubonensis TaxID=101571 RepID=UPI00075634FC|nr:response regulator transcription factor [Burkholderia ubonensis]AYZ62583.1 DNA-binding response regulator [Burkholderia multivorans]KUZ82813.1 helix-turn-helix transcriptional regulator [Burkholderia ubonensis]KUZ91388.1 helix-turn-helix transcriptional regulator [Burkholderia ubonensis]KVA15657.1 helix-turn-helix transcriptional regulator [Burkholderia ubonensis]KVA34177.1 helix-turn-helix transcriptional regulator [Burkholderia ubonensis]